MNADRATVANTTVYTNAAPAPLLGEVTRPPATAVGQAYAAIRAALLRGEYPIGLRLVEERLGRAVGVSRTPVREALLRLHAEGLVTRHPGGGYAPTVPNIARISELYEVRGALERSGLARPRRTGIAHDANVLASLRDEWQALAAAAPEPNPGFVEHDERFHVRLAEASGNQELALLLTRVNDRIRMVRMRDFLTADRITATVDEHLGLLDLVITGDLDGALAAYDDHLQASFDVVAERVASALLDMAGTR
jgi:DNA-binding GntR family transcriptional regulator